MKEGIKEAHESFGMIEIVKFTGGEQTYFGSSIRHSGGISIKIYNAEIERDLSKDWFFHSTVPIIEINMSHSQFAEMLTANMNTFGTPCTIKYKDGKLIDSPEFVNKRLQFEDEYKDQVKKINDKLDRLLKGTKEILSTNKSPKKSEKKAILESLRMLQQDIHANLPFLATQFNRQMNKTVTEAKAEVEGFYDAKIRNLGIEALQNKAKKPEIE